MTEAIVLDRVSLWRRTQEEFSYDLKRTILTLLEGKYRKPAKKIILDNINLTIQRGEKVGIIGANGSGKSTLLKVICGILQPTVGSVRVRGNIAPLIELGAGFDPELSVIDNIVLYGVMLGFTRQEMQKRAKIILEFAELKDYALVPVKGLSSGMKARLGFAIATDVEPDILILDEILSVGDESFRNKCEQKMQDFWKDHVTILLVSHSMELIQNSCRKSIWVNQGKIEAMGDTEQVIGCYMKSIH
ncbi:MAG: ABC transporter ATP-binding protein [Xenococcaceae cyanobacterium MO_207.B15]|nr:ABC transporter ATP-binding protein [Xenococcaceae cyanobacterium MO_207.B15]